MPNTWLISDTHFGHQGMCVFERDDGTPVRPWDNYYEMDLDMINWWNELVKPEDRVYHLGDFCINRRALPVQFRLNGRIVLIKGNHDIFKLEDYAGFDDIRAYHVLDGIILSHIPIHPSQKGRFRANIHGHTHYRRVLDQYGNPDPFYVPMSVEHWEYKPTLFSRVRELCPEPAVQY